MEDLVSVIIPVYNRSALVPRAIRSVLRQTHRNLEVLVVDDGSDEDIQGIVDRCQDPRLRFVRHEINQGAAAAFNTGINASQGPFLSFLGSDDEWLERKVEVLLDQMRRSDRRETVTYCLNEVYIDYESRVKPGNDFCKDGEIMHHALARCCVGMNQMLVPRDEIVAAGRMDEAFRMHMDWDLLIRLARRCRFSCVKEVLVRDHIHKYSRVTTDWGKSAHNMRTLYLHHRRLFEEDHEARSLFFESMAFINYRAGHREGAIGAQLRSVISDPLRLDAYLRMILLMTGRVDGKLAESE
ncbi:MAG: glycosyltransferase family 2 protein [Methanomassiliicoccales archaeon]|jgi:glycosyltransferase involved in cell wall biosynthesis